MRLDNRGGDDKGSGLGLAICRSIIELHHGRIWAESGADGRGLRVVFEIPAAQIAVDAAKDPTEKTRGRDAVLAG